MHSLDDTIAAVASPPGGAARGIVRVSGPDAFDCVARFFRDAEAAPPAEPVHPRASAGSLCLPELASPLPCEAYFWPRGRSYTGQAVAELHTLGSPPLLQTVLSSLCSLGVRLAEPGEFTLRAFLAGRIDLSQAEAVLGVIDATDRRELDVALRQLAGGLARPLNELRESLLDLLSHVEAGFDFADEDIPFIERDDLLTRLEAAGKIIAETLEQMASRGEAAGLESAVLIGRPNVGKSSLFNCLAAGAAALVADLPGTTRDYLVAELDLDGIKCRLIDTAGNRGEGRGERREGSEEGEGRREEPLEVSYELEAAAHSIAAEQTQNAAIRVLCLDATRQPDQWEIAALRGEDDRRIAVLTKCDVAADVLFDFSSIVGGDSRRRWSEAVQSATGVASYRSDEQFHYILRTSSATGEGVERLRAELRRKLAASRVGESDVVADTALRCRESLEKAARCIECARCEARSERDELAASEIRAALEELGRVVGAVYTDDVLERIFSRFCVGK